MVVTGRAERLAHQREIDAVDLLPLAPWIPTVKFRWVGIVPSSVTDRVFRRDPEPERYV